MAMKSYKKSRTRQHRNGTHRRRGGSNGRKAQVSAWDGEVQSSCSSGGGRHHKRHANMGHGKTMGGRSKRNKKKTRSRPHRGGMSLNQNLLNQNPKMFAVERAAAAAAAASSKRR